LVLKTIGQAKIAGVGNIINENPTGNVDKVAIVLGRKPLLYSLLPVGALNIWLRFYQVKQSCPNFDCQIIHDAY
jgi:hypothetical protein